MSKGCPETTAQTPPTPPEMNFLSPSLAESDILKFFISGTALSSNKKKKSFLLTFWKIFRPCRPGQLAGWRCAEEQQAAPASVQLRTRDVIDPGRPDSSRSRVSGKILIVGYCHFRRDQNVTTDTLVLLLLSHLFATDSFCYPWFLLSARDIDRYDFEWVNLNFLKDSNSMDVSFRDTPR